MINWFRMQIENNKMLLYFLLFLAIIVITFLLIYLLIKGILLIKESLFDRFVYNIIMKQEINKTIILNINRKKKIDRIKRNATYGSNMLVITFKDETAVIFKLKDDNYLENLTLNKKYSLNVNALVLN